MNIQDQAVKIIQEYAFYKNHPAFRQGMEDYRNGQWFSLGGFAGQCWDRGAECQMRINRMMEGA